MPILFVDPEDKTGPSCVEYWLGFSHSVSHIFHGHSDQCQLTEDFLDAAFEQRFIVLFHPAFMKSMVKYRQAFIPEKYIVWQIAEIERYCC